MCYIICPQIIPESVSQIRLNCATIKQEKYGVARPPSYLTFPEELVP